MTYKKKLIEVALPLEDINREAAREKSIRHGHPSTLHLWWARRPLAACRAVLFASLVDDPSECVKELLSDATKRAAAEKELKKRKKAWAELKAIFNKASGAGMKSVPDPGTEPKLEDVIVEVERERLFNIIRELVKWENSNSERVLNATRAEILRSCNGKLPPVYDPFCGGGSIPLEAQRLGLEAHASDLNPVPVLITKALIEIPPKFPNKPPVNPEAKKKLSASGSWKGTAGLSEDIRYYGQWMVGITTLFTSEGRYLLGNMSNAVPFEEYGKAVVEMLANAIERARTDMNWQKGDEVRLIFHSFKPLKDTEADAVKAIAESLKDYHVDFAFLHVAQEHDTVLFDSDGIGVKSYSAGVRGEDVMKGEYSPTRGTYLTLNKSNTILSLTGAREIKKPTDGLPYPVLLHLHRCSTFTDMKYLTEQVYTFAGHSWRSFDMSRMPVTIAYSQLIARLLGRLGALPHFSVDSIHGRLNRLRWFL